MIRSTLGMEAGKNPVQRIVVPDDFPITSPGFQLLLQVMPSSRIKWCLLLISCCRGICLAEVCSFDRAEAVRSLDLLYIQATGSVPVADIVGMRAAMGTSECLHCQVVV